MTLQWIITTIFGSMGVGIKCNNCNNTKNLLICGGCYSARYCDTDCQKLNRKIHKPKCVEQSEFIKTIPYKKITWSELKRFIISNNTKLLLCSEQYKYRGIINRDITNGAIQSCWTIDLLVQPENRDDYLHYYDLNGYLYELEQYYTTNGIDKLDKYASCLNVMLYILKSGYIMYDKPILHRLFIQLISSLYHRYSVQDIITKDRLLTCPAILPKFKLTVTLLYPNIFGTLDIILEKTLSIFMKDIYKGEIFDFPLMFAGIKMGNVNISKYPEFSLEVVEKTKYPTLLYNPVLDYNDYWWLN